MAGEYGWTANITLDLMKLELFPRPLLSRSQSCVGACDRIEAELMQSSMPLSFGIK